MQKTEKLAYYFSDVLAVPFVLEFLIPYKFHVEMPVFLQRVDGAIPFVFWIHGFLKLKDGIHQITYGLIRKRQFSFFV